MSFINEAAVPVVQHRNWNWKLGQASSAPAAVAFVVVPGFEVGSKYSNGGTAFTANTFNPDDGSGAAGWTGGAYGAAGFVVVGSGASSAISANGISGWIIGTLAAFPPPLTFVGSSQIMAYLRGVARWSLGNQWSSDGINWNLSAGSGTGGICASQTFNRFYQANGSSGALYSANGDGGTWVSVPAVQFSSSFGLPINVKSMAAGATQNSVWACGEQDINLGIGTLSRVCIWRSNDGAIFSSVYVDPTPYDADFQGCMEIAVSDDGTALVALYNKLGSAYLLYSNDSGIFWNSILLGAANLATKWNGLQWCAGNFYATRTNGQVLRGATGDTMAVVQTSIPAFATGTGCPVCNF